MNNLVRKCIRFGAYRGLFDWLRDETYLKLLYKARLNKTLNLKNPSSFNEKLQWLKLNYRKEELSTLVDKIAAKEYVSKILGEEFIIPTIGVWNHPDEIDFDALPNQFVLKCNHNSGLGMYICKDKRKMNVEQVKEELSRGLKEDYYSTSREWPYKNVKRQILAEQYMVSEEDGLTDYKVHNFNGEPGFVLVCKDRFKSSGLTEDFFTPDWTHMNVKRPGNQWASRPIEKPDELEEMLEISRILAKDMPFIRTDFYIINHKLYFSEFTFFPASGFEKFEPEHWDQEFGSWLKLEL